MPRTIISDTSCLILLEKIGELEILHALFGEVLITSKVAEEFGMDLPEWIKIRDASNQTIIEILESSVDQGEASSIALAFEYLDSLLILDDLKARKLAYSLGLKITGTIGVLINGKHKGLFESAQEIIEKIRQTNFHISVELETKLLEK